MYIKYAGGGGGGFYTFFKDYFVAQGTIERNTSWPSDIFKKYSRPLQLILVSHLSLDCRRIPGWILFTEIQSDKKR